jgi:hypothetical protein
VSRGKRIFTVLGLLFFLFSSLPLAHAQYKRLISLYGQDDNELFGQRILAEDVSGDGLPDLFVGAPGATENRTTQAGHIYLLQSPFSDTRAATDDELIILGTARDQKVGQRFELGDFNGDGTSDIALSVVNYTSDNKGLIAIFYGPFEPGSPRTLDDADVTIEGSDSDDSFGQSLAVVPDIDKDGDDELIVGAHQSSLRGLYSGVAYLFKSLDQPQSLTSSQRDIMFIGDEANAQYGIAVQAFKDINDDGEVDIAIGAHRSSLNGSNNGAVFIYEGPFSQSQYEDGDANTRILGRDVADDNGTFWGSRIFNLGDLTGDGNEEMAIVSVNDDGGKVAYFEGRGIWADPITVTEPGGDATSDHVVFDAYRSAAGYGISLDFGGDYNLDDVLDPIIGAPLSGSSEQGRGVVASIGGNALSWLPEGGNSVNSNFGQQMVSVGNIYTSEDDIVERVDETITLEIDDFWVSAPGDNASEIDQNTNPGAVHLYTGTILKPSSSLTYTPSYKAEIGDTIEVKAKYVPGSMPIQNAWFSVQRDTTFLDPAASDDNPYVVSFHPDTAGLVELEYFVQDEIGFYVKRNANLRFAAYPKPFSLNSIFDGDTLEITGDPQKVTTFSSEASADTNGYRLNYRPVLSMTSDSAEVPNKDFNRFDYQSSPEFEISYQTINEFLRDKGVPLNQVTTIYWTVEASNGVFSRLGGDGQLIPLKVVRRGLDPYFSLTDGEELWVIDGRAEQKLSVSWGKVVAENPNVNIRYRFKLLASPDTSSTVLLDEYSNNDGFDTSYDITFGELDQVLADNKLREDAKQDTLQLGYTVEAIFDGSKSYYPTEIAETMKVRRLNLVGIPQEDKPERPKDFVLHSNYPNPFNPTTTLRYSLPEPREVSIRIFNILGQPVFSWSSKGKLSTGAHTLTINAMEWSSGIYLYQVQAGNEQRTGKMSLVK